MSAAPPRVENDNPYAAPLADTDAAEPVTARWTDLRMQPEEGELEDPRRLPLAPRMVRLGGALIDWVFAVIFGVVAIMFFGGRSGEAQDLRAVAWVGIGMALVIQSVLIARRGQSLGKMSLGMKIVNYDTDEDADPGRTVLVRTWLPLLLNLIPFFKLIDILFIFNAEHRCLHDILAGTRVVDIRGEYVRT